MSGLGRSPRPFLQDILDSIERVERFSGDLDLAGFLQDDMAQDAIVRRIEVIGEAVSRLPDALKTRHPEVPWQDIKDMRNRLIHDYGQVDLALVWAVVERELPVLKRKVQAIIGGLDQSPTG
jgi:uncharacterized protein with HEPN domain